MTYGQWPGQDGQQGWPGAGGGAVPPQWRQDRQEGTRLFGPYEQQRHERGNGQRGDAPQQPLPQFPPAWSAQPGEPGFGPSRPQPAHQPPYPPYQPPQPPSRPPYRPPQRGQSWPARHKALTAILALVGLVIIIAAANAGRSPSSPGGRTTAGLTTTASPTATKAPSHHATQAAATAQTTQPAPTQAAQTRPAQTQPAAPAATRSSAPPATHSSAPAAPASTTPAAVVPPPASSAAPAGCHPLTNAGNCYEPGEFCRASDHGVSGVAGDGESITCEDNDGWRWEPS